MLEIENVSHAYGDLVSLNRVSLRVGSGEIVCLLGPSGCGKTTLLRIVAGLEAAAEGAIRFAGVDLAGAPAHRRNFGLMFQDFALFPHMNVADNIAYGLRRRGESKRVIAREVESLLARVGLPGMRARDVAALSGGQQQRVALARSLAPRPRLLMLDEPLGSLDAQLRDQLALELRQIIKDQGLSAIYVTHDHREAYAVADKIAVMNIGAVEQVATPQSLYRKPKTAFVAMFLGMRNIFGAGQGDFAARLLSALECGRAEARAVLIHPSGIAFGTTTEDRSLCLDGALVGAVFRGDYYDVNVSLDCGASLYFPSPTLPVEFGAETPVRVAKDALIALDG